MSDQLKFKIGLSGTYYGEKKPEYSVTVNDVEYAHGTIVTPSNETEFIEFTVELEDGDNVLGIHFLNKENEDVLKDNYEDPVNFNIIGDLLLNVESIEIDDIDLGNLRYSASKFIPLEHPEIEACVNLGHKGKYVLGFTTPFYLWLLENM